MRLQGEQELKRIAQVVLAQAQADQVEVVLFSGSSALTRFANNYIHQNVDETDTSVQVRAVIGQKIGVASTDAISDESLRALADRAVMLARLQQDNPDFRSLPGPGKPLRHDAFNQETAEFSPEQRAIVVGDVCRAAQDQGLVAAGAFRTSATEVAVANSLGVWVYDRLGTADINTVIMGESSSGYAERLTLDATEIDGAAIAAEAIDKCLRGAAPHALEPGQYDVILEEYAVADLMDYFSYLAFGAQAFVEQRSFMSGRLGQPIMGQNVSLWDDALSLAGIPSPFDAEGVQRKRVEFVTGGVAREVVWDSYYAGKAGRESTGHALPAGETFGPAPVSIFMATGDSSVAEMIASTRRGILVSRFWYTRPVHPLTVVMTGMTRDGTFLIEDGRIVAPLNNLRFTHSYLEAMNNVELIGRESRLLPMAFGACRVPALKIRGWEFI